jgi:hypothetical protein
MESHFEKPTVENQEGDNGEVLHIQDEDIIETQHTVDLSQQRELAKKEDQKKISGLRKLLGIGAVGVSILIGAANESKAATAPEKDQSIQSVEQEKKQDSSREVIGVLKKISGGLFQIEENGDTILRIPVRKGSTINGEAIHVSKTMFYRIDGNSFYELTTKYDELKEKIERGTKGKEDVEIRLAKQKILERHVMLEAVQLGQSIDSIEELPEELQEKAKALESFSK